MKMFRLMIVFALVLMTAIAALAADTVPVTAANPFGDALSSFFTNTLLPVFGAMVLGFISWAAKKFGDKYKIAGLQDSNGFLMQLAAQGVAFAEEKAANFAKNAQPLTGNDKLNAAIAYVMQNAPKVTDAQAQSLVTAALATLPGMGATGTTVIAAAPVATLIMTEPIKAEAAVPAAAPQAEKSAPLFTDPLAVAP